MRLPGEPSVDEILDSIKKVIARDDRAGSPGAAPDAEGEGDVLDLAESPSYLAGVDQPAPPSGDAGGPAPLVTAGSRAAMREKLAALAALAEPRTGRLAARPAETSLEDLARELLRPALAEWLDHNLPAIVERLVAGEIARIVGKQS